MHLNIRVLFLPTSLLISGVLAQQTATPTSGTPDVTYPVDDAFIFCSGQDCTGTCEVVDSANDPRDDGEYALNGIDFQSIDWYDPGNYGYDLYTCINYEYCGIAVGIGPNTCYNLYYNGTPTDYYECYYLVA